MSFKVTAINRIHESWGDDPDDFLVQAHGEIQNEGHAGGEAIVVYIASAKGLDRHLRTTTEAEPGRGYLFMVDYDERKALQCLQEIVSRAGAQNWDQLQAYVERYFDWLP